VGAGLGGWIVLMGGGGGGGGWVGVEIGGFDFVGGGPGGLVAVGEVERAW